jgi:hypothetical protein
MVSGVRRSEYVVGLAIFLLFLQPSHRIHLSNLLTQPQVFATQYAIGTLPFARSLAICSLPTVTSDCLAG